MSIEQNSLLSGNQAITNFDLSKIFVYNNRYETGTINNSEYNPMTILAGTVLGRIAGTGNLFPCVSTATDGSQYPIGILAADVIIQDGSIMNVPYCVSGDVIQAKIILWNAPTDTLSTVVSGRQLLDRIGSDSVGIKIVPGIENTYTDNQ